MVEKHPLFHQANIPHCFLKQDFTYFLKLIQNLQTFYLSLPGTWITGMCHYACFVFYTLQTEFGSKDLPSELMAVIQNPQIFRMTHGNSLFPVRFETFVPNRTFHRSYCSVIFSLLLVDIDTLSCVPW